MRIGLPRGERCCAVVCPSLNEQKTPQALEYHALNGPLARNPKFIEGVLQGVGGGWGLHEGQARKFLATLPITASLHPVHQLLTLSVSFWLHPFEQPDSTGRETTGLIWNTIEDENPWGDSQIEHI
jgi:hypothetical protein